MRVAIIGGGISGLLTAHLLRDEVDLAVFEKQDWIGGHSHTVELEEEHGSLSVDTGFIVFNEENYPIFSKLSQELEVETIPAEMSFGVHCEESGLQYNARSFDTLFAQRSNLFSPSFWRMLWEARYCRKSFPKLVEIEDENLSVKEYLQAEGYSNSFIEKMILPLAASIWSSPKSSVEAFPLKLFVTFFKNHGFLGHRRQYHWRTVKGGAKRYVEKLIQGFADSIFKNTSVERVLRRDSRVELYLQDGRRDDFDEVIFACHSDEALKLLGDGATEDEREILSALPYQENEVVLHWDRSLLPRQKKLWASWNYFIPKGEQESVCISYDMSILQSLAGEREYIVTLNQRDRVDEARILGSYEYSHPQFLPGALAAQRGHSIISGKNRSHYCGAYWRYGFHEDGAMSALRVANAFGVSSEG